MALVSSSLTIPPAGALNTVAAVRALAAAGARSLIPVTYGLDRQPALILNVLPKAGDANTLLVQCLWGHALHQVDELRLADQAVPAGATATHYTGSQTAADSDLVAAFAAQGITYGDTLAGYAYSVVAMPTRSFQGSLDFSARLWGRRLYDPRKDSTAGGSGAHRLANPATWEWSDNPSLATADWLASTVYGAGEPVDWASVPAAANANDALVGGEKRRLIGVSLSADGVSVRAVAEALRAYAGCWLVPGAAGVKLLADAATASVASYLHASGQIARLESLTLKDLGNVPTAVEVLYTDTSQIPWREMPAVASLPGAGSTRPLRVSTVRLPGVQRYSQAYREAVERLNKLTLGDLSFPLEVFDQGIRHERGDIITVTHPLGLSAKPLRVTDVEMTSHGRWRLQVTEHDPAAYSDEVQTAPSIPDTTRTLAGGPASAVAGFSASVSKGRIVWSWTPDTDPSYGATELRTSDASWGLASPAPAFRGAANSFQQVVTAPGTYTLYARHVTVGGQVSAAAASATVAVTAADLVLDGLPGGNTLNADAGCERTTAWEFVNGAVLGTTTAVGAVGTGCLQFPGGALNAMAMCAENIPLNPARRFRLSARLQAAAGNDRSMYVVVRMFRANGSELNGADTGWGGTYAGYVFGGVPVSDGVFREYGSDFGVGVPGAPIPSDVAYCRVGVWGQYEGGGSSGTSSLLQLAQDVRLVDVTDVRAADAAAAVAQATADSADAAAAAAQAAADSADAAAAAAQAAADSANTTLAAIASDNVLTRGEKSSVILEVTVITGEQAGIDAQAAAQGITTERTAYNAAISTLTSYLAGLSPAWNDLGSDTAITGSTFRTRFADVYAARQTLLNKIAEGAEGPPGPPGADGADGADGLDGADGAPAVTGGVDRAAVVLAAWSDGVIKTGALPLVVSAFSKIGGTTDTANWAWSRSATSGITTSIAGAAVTITAMDAALAAGEITITGTRSGYSDIVVTVPVTKALDTVPSAGPTNPMGNHGASAARVVSSGSVTTTAGFELRADGTIYVRTNSSGSDVWTKVGDWYKPTGSPGGSYEVLFQALGITLDTTGTGGTVTGTLGSWQGLGSTRAVTLTRTATGTWQIERSFSYAVRRSSDGLQVGGGTFALDISREV